MTCTKWLVQCIGDICSLMRSRFVRLRFLEGLAMASKGTIITYILAEHSLAGEFVLQSLHRDKTIQAVVCTQVSKFAQKDANPIFIIDSDPLSVPLGNCIRHFSDHFLEAKFIVLVPHCEDMETATILRNGVHGVVLHSKVWETLVDAVHAVAKGEFWVTPQGMKSYLTLTTRRRNSHSPCDDLPTPRETEILEFVKLRRTNREIAEFLGVQESTVKYHLSNIFGKLRIARRTELLRNSGCHFQFWDEMWKVKKKASAGRQL